MHRPAYDIMIVEDLAPNKRQAINNSHTDLTVIMV